MTTLLTALAILTILAILKTKLPQKGNKEKGDEFERYTGKLLESNGWQVKYNGLNKGNRDSGLDLICKKENITALIQCKYISNTEKWFIREDVVNQLYGATEFYKKKNTNKNVLAAIATTGKLSKEAIEVAETHGIEINKINDFKLKF